MRSVTLRAEIARLRQALASFDATLRLESQPYRIDPRIVPDTAQFIDAIDRGAHRRALREFGERLLPQSRAPGVVEIRDELQLALRTAVLERGSVEAVIELINQPAHRDDVDGMLEALRLLPEHSPKRAVIRARLALLGE